VLPVLQGRQGVLRPVLVRLPPGSDSPTPYQEVPITARKKKQFWWHVSQGAAQSTKNPDIAAEYTVGL